MTAESIATFKGFTKLLLMRAYGMILEISEPKIRGFINCLKPLLIIGAHYERGKATLVLLFSLYLAQYLE